MSSITKLTLVYTDGDEVGGNSINFSVEDGVDFLEAFYAATKEYIETEEGTEFYRSIRGNFGAGDAVNEVPEHIFKKHGILPLSEKVDDHLTLENDESMFSEYDLHLFGEEEEED